MWNQDVKENLMEYKCLKKFTSFMEIQFFVIIPENLWKPREIQTSCKVVKSKEKGNELTMGDLLIADDAEF